jgi:magnesium chelatase family protein
MGELDGSLQPIRGALPIAIKAKEEDLKAFFPKQNVKEAALLQVLMYGVENVQEVIDFLKEI